MPMYKNPSEKYSAFIPPSLPDRTWPSKTLVKAPRWLATDLRDGNQSLAHPLTVDQKWTYFNILLDIGFKEIDVSFPSASDTEFDFTRKLVETPGAVPEDVWLQVLSPCRKELIRRTVDSVTGSKKAIISLYIASSDSFQSTIFGLTRQDVLEMAVDCVRYTKSITKDDPSQQGTTWNLMFSPEAFPDTDSAYASQLCEAVKEAWEPTVEVPMILNLPATVEMSTPNVFADQVELFYRSLSNKDKFVLSLHPHNDRGCAVAAAELGQLAGATRVEGCLFGNGERTGNVDLVTLALNLYTQGIDPNLDFSDLPTIRKTIEELTRIPVHIRAPYAGDSVFLAYSGSHQDAINKGFKIWDAPVAEKKLWKVPYLPLDPKDIGATYESVIRVNSQSGKGGVAWTLQRTMALDLPKGLQQAFSKVVKRHSDKEGRTLAPTEVAELFLREYHLIDRDPRIIQYEFDPRRDDGALVVSAQVVVGGLAREIRGTANSVPAAISSALAIATSLQISFDVYDRTWSENGKTHKMVVAMCKVARKPYTSWGANISENVEEAALLACLSAAMGLQQHLPSLRLLPLAYTPNEDLNSKLSSRMESIAA